MSIYYWKVKADIIIRTAGVGKSTSACSNMHCNGRSRGRRQRGGRGVDARGREARGRGQKSNMAHSIPLDEHSPLGLEPKRYMTDTLS